jgi:hypothetical protein
MFTLFISTQPESGLVVGGLKIEELGPLHAAQATKTYPHLTSTRLLIERRRDERGSFPFLDITGGSCKHILNLLMELTFPFLLPTLLVTS